MKTCQDCGNYFEAGPRVRFCPDCRKKHRDEYKKGYNLRHKKPIDDPTTIDWNTIWAYYKHDECIRCHLTKPVNRWRLCRNCYKIKSHVWGETLYWEEHDF